MNNIEFIPFNINFPVKIFSKNKINFENKKTRDRVFNRSIYSYKYENSKNHVPEERWELLLLLAKEIKQDIEQKYKKDILSISAFGSSLYSKNNNDYDFLVIVNGNKFDMLEKYISIEKSKYKIGISIKGKDNFINGIIDKESPVPIRLQSQIIYRTVISLSKRHIPIIGYDFIYDKELFINNCYAQVSDLLSNSYDLYYLNKKKLPNKDRSRKISSRLYEASLYLGEIDPTKKIKQIQKEIYNNKISEISLNESKKIFDNFRKTFNKSMLNYNLKKTPKKNPLRILNNKKAKDIITQRLKKYWKFAKLPYEWIEKIIEILDKYNYDESLAIKKIRKYFPEIVDEKSKKYSIKLSNFRKRKVDILSNYISKKMLNGIVVDFGGRSDDFSKHLLNKNKSIKKIYVTDVGSYIKKTENDSIEFVVQPSLNSIPIHDKAANTIIISMVLHHIPRENYKSLFREIKRVTSDNGRTIVIEDSYPKNYDKKNLDKNYLSDFMNLGSKAKTDILYFYDWFGNRLMRNRDTIPVIQNFRPIEKWIKIFKNNGFKCKEYEFITTPNKCLFPPKSILIFEKS